MSDAVLKSLQEMTKTLNDHSESFKKLTDGQTCLNNDMTSIKLQFAKQEENNKKIEEGIKENKDKIQQVNQEINNNKNANYDISRQLNRRYMV